MENIKLYYKKILKEKFNPIAKVNAFHRSNSGEASRTLEMITNFGAINPAGFKKRIRGRRGRR